MTGKGQNLLKMAKLIQAMLVLAFFAYIGAAPQLTEPELPREYVDITYQAPTGNIISVPAGGNFQTAIDNAQPGDVIELEAGAIFFGQFFLREKANPQNKWIIIRSSAHANLPPEGTRVLPQDSVYMPKLLNSSSQQCVIVSENRAGYYRLMGIQVYHKAMSNQIGIVQLGDRTISSVGDQPHHIIIDRCLIHGFEYSRIRRGVEMQGRHQAVINSHLSAFKNINDAQAICGWNGQGPFKITNNRLEATGENIMFGGIDAEIQDLSPSDIEINRNYFTKPLTWRDNDTSISVKNLFELKHAVRVLIEDNIFEYNWTASDQSGYCINMYSVNQNGANPWFIVGDITIRNNIMRHCNVGFFVGGNNTRRVRIENNLIYDVSTFWGANRKVYGVGFRIASTQSRDIFIEHNTLINDGDSLMMYGHNLLPNTFQMINNVFTTQYRAVQCVDSNTCRNNPLLGPADFANFNGDNYRLGFPDNYLGTDGKPAGVDFDTVEFKTNGVIAGLPANGVIPRAVASSGPVDINISASCAANGRIAFRINLDSPGRIRLSVYGLAGRKLWEEEGNVRSGEHVIKWERRTRGSAVARGVYIVKLRQGCRTVADRFVTLLH